MGGEITIGDDNSVDGELKIGISSKPIIPVKSVSGVEKTMTITGLGDMKNQTTKMMSPFTS